MRPPLRTVLITVGLLAVLPGIAAAQSGAGELQPLVDLLNSIAQMLTYLGVAIGVVGITASGILYMWPGPDTTIKAKRLFSNVLIGLVIIGFATVIVGWLAGELGLPTA